MPLLPGIPIGVCLSPPPPEAVRRALDAVLAEGRYQTELPVEGGRLQPSRVDTFQGFGLAQALAVLGIAAIAVLAGIWLFRAVAGRRRAAVAPPRGAPVVAPVLDGVPLGEIEALAAAGRFDEAVHVLLLQSIAAVGRTVSTLPVSLTSREVLGRAPLPDGAREELEAIVDAVETSWFGGRPVGRPGFEACRERYRRFAVLCGGATA